MKEAVAAGIEALVAEHRAAIRGFGEDTRPDTIGRAAERIRLTRHKVDSYGCYLAEERSRLDRELADAAQELRARVESLAEESPPVGVS